MESIMLDPGVQELVNEWVEKGRAMARAEARAELHAMAYAQGRIEEARMVLHVVLAARSLSVTPSACVRIGGERDLARLESWLQAAVLAGSIDDVFRDGSLRP